MDYTFIKKPNLPENKVLHVAIGEVYLHKYKNAFEKYGIKAISLRGSDDIPPPLDSHADMNLLHMGTNKFISASQNIRSIIGDSQIKYISAGGVYPEDCCCNAAIIGDYAFCYEQSPLIGILKENGLKPIPVRQGYCKCNICIVNEKSFITSDKGIKNAADANGFDCLLINPGYIEIDKYDYGFIGGCSFKIDSNKICFTGKLNAHPDENKIVGFCKTQGVDLLYLTDENVFDIGSVLPITEISHDALT